MSHTTYQCTILAAHTESLLDRFGQFFACPTLSQDSAQREVQAVNSEHGKNALLDVRRRLQILKEVADSEHHWSKFSTGNKDTLDTESAYEAMREFHRVHYRPDNMSACVVGPLDLDELQRLSVETFSRIPDRSLLPHACTDEISDLIAEAADDAAGGWKYSEALPPPHNVFSKLEKPSVVSYVPVKKTRTLIVNYLLPNDAYKLSANKDPLRFLCHLIGHEGQGSIFAYLQDKHFITGLSCGTKIRAPDQSVLSVTMQLTAEGLEKWLECVQTVYSYCDLLREANPTALMPLLQEEQNLDELARQWSAPNSNVFSVAPALSKALQQWGSEGCLTRGNLHSAAPLDMPVQWESFVKAVVPENSFVERTVREFSSKKTIIKSEPWYGAEYTLEPLQINTATLTALHLPHTNSYIPQHDLELSSELPPEAVHVRLDEPIQPPTPVHSGGRNSIQVWHALDQRYALPKAKLSLSMPFELPHSAIHLGLLLSAFDLSQRQETYDASLAGMSWSLSTNAYGLQLSVGGYHDDAHHDSITALSLHVLQEFLCLDQMFLKDNFEAAWDARQVALSSFHNSTRSDALARYYTNLFMKCPEDSEDYLSVERQLEILEHTTLEDVMEVHTKLVRKLRQQEGISNKPRKLLFTGNVGRSRAVKTADRLYEFLVNDETTGTNVDMEQQKSTLELNVIERSLPRGSDIALHFSTTKSQDDGAVWITCQAPLFGFGSSSGSISCYGTNSPTKHSQRQSAALRLLSHMIREPFFNELRTKQQLGYVVGCSFLQRYIHNPNPTATAIMAPVEGFQAYVLSRKCNAVEVKKRMDDFFLHYGTTILNEMAQSEFDAHVHALCRKMRKPLCTLGEEHSMYWNRILRDQVCYNATDQDQQVWEMKEELARSVESLKKEDVMDVYWSIIFSSDKDEYNIESAAGRVVSYVHGNAFPMADTLSSNTDADSDSGVALAVINDENALMYQAQSLPLFHGNAPGFRSFRKKRGGGGRGGIRSVVRRIFSGEGSLKNVLSSVSLSSKFGAGAATFGMLGFAMTFWNRVWISTNDDDRSQSNNYRTFFDRLWKARRS